MSLTNITINKKLWKKLSKTLSKTLWVMIIVFLLIAPGSYAQAQNSSRGIQGRSAPKWNVEKWLNLPAGKNSVEIEDYRGKVLYLYCFQSWCPGCIKYGFPALREVSESYEKNEDVAFVAIQTVFEGFSANTFSRARGLAEQFSLEMPIGQSGEHGERSLIMSRYRTGGTPWTIIIDANGIVRYNDFHLEPKNAAKIIDNLLTEKANDDAKLKNFDSDN